MIVFFEILIWLLLLFSLLYFIVVAVFIYGWFTLKQDDFFDEASEKVSVVVAVRNEEKNISGLLNALLHQTYSHQKFEIIIVNDHSEDNTVKLIEDFSALNDTMNIKLLQVSGLGKKQAVSQGIKNSANRLILTTDGDCVPPKRWIETMAGYFVKHRPRIILGAVAFWGEKSLKQRFFSLDFMSLVASGAGSAGAGLPFMGNAANMAFDKTVFNDFGQQQAYASGDDVFLIHWVKKHYGGKSIHFLKDVRALVVTRPPEGWRVFLNQRLRWASKAKGYYDGWSIMVSGVVLLFNLGLAALFFTGFLWSWMWIVWFLFVALKTLIDFPLISGYAQLAGKSGQLIYLWAMELIYPFYITIAGIGSLFVKYSWKGRAGLR